MMKTPDSFRHNDVLGLNAIMGNLGLKTLDTRLCLALSLGLIHISGVSSLGLEISV